MSARLIRREYRRDPSLCRKELDLYAFLRGSIPVPDAVEADPDADPPYALFRYVEGVTLDRFDGPAAGRSAGETLAAIHRITFERSGWIGPGLAIGGGIGSVAGFIEERIGCGDIVRPFAAELDALQDQSRLVHGDYNGKNLVVAPDGRIVVVLDWEFAVSSTPLMDIGNFLRHGDSPAFLDGYRGAGGALPPDWKRLSLLVDLSALAVLRDTAAIERTVQRIRRLNED
jgi:aminoglycoside phosphotransferase (APT) family kinase protein